MVEAVTGNVQVAVPASGLHALEAKQVVFIASDKRSQFGSPDFYTAAVRSENEYRRVRPFDDVDSVILSFHFVFGEFGE
jgi:hypothetical protein